MIRKEDFNLFMYSTDVTNHLDFWIDFLLTEVAFVLTGVHAEEVGPEVDGVVSVQNLLGLVDDLLGTKLTLYPLTLFNPVLLMVLWQRFAFLQRNKNNLFKLGVLRNQIFKFVVDKGKMHVKVCFSYFPATKVTFMIALVQRSKFLAQVNNVMAVEVTFIQIIYRFLAFKTIHLSFNMNCRFWTKCFSFVICAFGIDRSHQWVRNISI